jgi:hypothetical protein
MIVYLSLVTVKYSLNSEKRTLIYANASFKSSHFGEERKERERRGSLSHRADINADLNGAASISAPFVLFSVRFGLT